MPSIWYSKVIGRIYKYDRRKCPYPSTKNTFFYHNVLRILYKLNLLVLMMLLWVHMIYHLLYQIKSLFILLIPTSTIMMIHIHLKHLGKIVAVLPGFGVTITTTNTQNSSTLPPPRK